MQRNRNKVERERERERNTRHDVYGVACDIRTYGTSTRSHADTKIGVDHCITDQRLRQPFWPSG